MSIGYVILTIIHFSVSVFLILVILLQTGKGADMGAVFGGSSQTVFGSSGAGGFLTKMTTVGAVVFMFTCLSLAYIQGNTSSGVLRELEQSKPIEAPAAPAAPLPEEWGTGEATESEAAPADTAGTGEAAEAPADAPAAEGAPATSAPAAEAEASPTGGE